MMETPRCHLLCQLIMPLNKRRGVEEIFINVTGKRLTLIEATGKHVAFDVFSQEVPVAHVLWVNHPHSHSNLAVRKKWINKGYTDQSRSGKNGAGEGIRTLDVLLGNRSSIIKKINSLSLSQLNKLTGFSKPYLSFVKTGKRPASLRLLKAVAESMPVRQGPNYITLFIQSRKAIGVSPHTIEYYSYTLGRYLKEVDYLKATKASINKYLNGIPPNQYGLATRHSAYRAMKTLHRWLQDTYDIPNPMKGIRAPILGKPILPTLDEVQVKQLINATDCIRDKATIALFVESGLRLSELVNIKASDINWQGRCIKVLGKGRKEAFAPFGDVAAGYMQQWLADYKSTENIWGINAHGIATMLRRLETATGITCNPHTFRRTFAVLLRKAGVDTMTIKELGRWESLEMVQRYTRSFSFQDSMKFYKSPLS